MKTLITIGLFLLGFNLKAQQTTTTSTYRVVAQSEKSVEVVKPSYVGGEEAMKKFISETIEYPEDAKALNQYGKVYVAFEVKEDGTLINLEVTKGLSPDLDAEALRVVQAMPKWNPGTKNGEASTMRYYIPIEFKLK